MSSIELTTGPQTKMHNRYILAIDSGTTSTRAIIFDAGGRVVHSSQAEIYSHCNELGWVEQDAREIWRSTLAACRDVIAKTKLQAKDLYTIGITNQRETTVIWEKRTGQPIHNAIVWQDRRTAAACEKLKAQNLEKLITRKTGLLVDPYFSATKISWLLDNVPSARQLAINGELLFGTIDTWLLWNLTGGVAHATDATNASRTLLFNINEQRWDDELLAIFDIPAKLLPIVKDSAAFFGHTAKHLFETEIPIHAILGDQQAALVGQACFAPGMTKSTYGTGCFLVMNTGSTIVRSNNRLLSTIAYRINGETTYAVEGSIFVAGAAIQWLRDNLRLLESASQSESLAKAANRASGVYFVPAFTGLGAPYWDPHARGAITGLTRDTGIGEIVAAGLQAVCYQTRDLLESIQRDGNSIASNIRIDGGMVANNWFSQCLADVIGVPVERPTVIETTALGAAYMAGLGSGLFESLDQISRLWESNARFSPRASPDVREALYNGWLNAVGRLTQLSPIT